MTVVSSKSVNEVLYREQPGGDDFGMSRELGRLGSDRLGEARQHDSFRYETRGTYGEPTPTADSPWPPPIKTLHPLATAGNEVKSFVTNTVKSLLKWGAERLVDLIAPGVGAAITTFEHMMTLVKTGETFIKGKGEVSVPVAEFGAFEFKASVHVGNDRTGRELPVSAFIAPIDDTSPLGDFDVEPDSEHRYAAMAPTDLSGLSRLPEPASRAGVIRSYTEQQVLPRLRRDHSEKVELVYVIDKETGIGAWLHVADETTDWCLLVWRNGQAKSHSRTRGIPSIS